MTKDVSVVSLGDISKPASVLIEKISDAVGGIFEPYQIKRVAKAKAKAKKIEASANIQITQQQHRALRRLLQEETNKQNNIESITEKSLPLLNANSNPKEIENDWLVNFFDKGKMISDSEMQDLWSKILAGEANAPGSYSKRTVNMISSLDKKDAILFNSLCNFVWTLGKTTIPIVFDLKNKLYTERGINFESIKHLDSIGLISFENLTGYVLNDLPQNIRVLYNSRPVSISFPNAENNVLNIGHIMFTSVGVELFRVCGMKSIEGFAEYVVEKWKSDNLNTTVG